MSSSGRSGGLRLFGLVLELLDLVDDGPPRLGRQGVDVALERRHAVGPAPPADDHRPDANQHDHRDDDDDDDQHRHDTAPAPRIGVAPVPHALPSRQVSCFQIGTDAFSASMA